MNPFLFFCSCLTWYQKSIFDGGGKECNVHKSVILRSRLLPPLHFLFLNIKLHGTNRTFHWTIKLFCYNCLFKKTHTLMKIRAILMHPSFIRINHRFNSNRFCLLLQFNLKKDQQQQQFWATMRVVFVIYKYQQSGFGLLFLRVA